MRGRRKLAITPRLAGGSGIVELVSAAAGNRETEKLLLSNPLAAAKRLLIDLTREEEILLVSAARSAETLNEFCRQLLKRRERGRHFDC